MSKKAAFIFVAIVGLCVVAVAVYHGIRKIQQIREPRGLLAMQPEIELPTHMRRPRGSTSTTPSVTNVSDSGSAESDVIRPPLLALLRRGNSLLRFHTSQHRSNESADTLPRYEDPPPNYSEANHQPSDAGSNGVFRLQEAQVAEVLQWSDEQADETVQHQP